ncbi:MAG TPA: hypothetical protein VE871_04590 [Longimicrobium sp.]|nr:hypothetical protein [Longimicrobium sp.]
MLWSGPAGSGTVAAVSEATDVDGFIRGTWTLGTRAGVQELVATVDGTSLDPAVATLVSTTARAALVSGVAAGTARIVARSDGKAATVTVVVTAPPAAGRVPR